MPKIKVKLSPLFHRGMECIKVDLPNTNEAKDLIRSINGRKWSKTHHCWYLPKKASLYLELQRKFDIITVSKTINSNKTGIKKPIAVNRTANIASPEFYEVKFPDGTIQKRVMGNKILLFPEKETRFKAYIPYFKKGWIEVIKEIPGRAWNTEESYWSMPKVKDSFRQIWSLGKENIEISFPIESDIPEKFEQLQFVKDKINKGRKVQLNEVQKRAKIALEEKFILEGKSWRTIKTYIGLFNQFLLFHSDMKPSSISKKQIEQFLIYKKRDENASNSQLNQIINTLNAFYIRLLDQKEKVSKLERPKKKKKLPNIFSEEEIILLLKSCKNLKHKSILILIYSAGLRKGEVLNLRPSDIDFDRKTIFIKNGKGGKDRYSFFSINAQKYLKEYLKQYCPKHYLFEGQKGGRYSESSLQTIFETARKKAEVKPFVTLHGLRHSFATHLVERNVPLHVVQELLGHSSIKTTEIYLHISNKFRKELRSPLDDLEL